MKQRVSFLDRAHTGLLVIDVQDCLVAAVDRGCEVVQNIATAVRGCSLLKLPIIISEQYPKGLGPTTLGVKMAFEEGTDLQIFTKTTFSCLGDSKFREYILSCPVKQWILVGMEAHVCVLQTAKDLLREGLEVTVLNDSITSRSVFDFSTAIAELRDCGARVTCTEAALFELLKDSQASEFKAISQLIR
ncbi:MAG: isochorismatase family protein [Parachlamydiales bacterium]|jgi:nicotinamidase-related amidase